MQDSFKEGEQLILEIGKRPIDKTGDEKEKQLPYSKTKHDTIHRRNAAIVLGSLLFGEALKDIFQFYFVTCIVLYYQWPAFYTS